MLHLPKIVSLAEVTSGSSGTISTHYTKQNLNRFAPVMAMGVLITALSTIMMNMAIIRM